MTAETIIFYLLLLVVIFHELKKINKSYYIYSMGKEIKKETDLLKRSQIFQNNPDYKKICYFDMFETLLLIYGIFSDSQWECFLGILVLSLSKIQKINPLFVKIDAILTVVILIIAYYKTFICLI